MYVCQLKLVYRIRPLVIFTVALHRDVAHFDEAGAVLILHANFKYNMAWHAPGIFLWAEALFFMSLHFHFVGSGTQLLPL